MSVLLEKAAEPQVQFRSSLSFHLYMAYACSALLLIDWFAFRLICICFLSFHLIRTIFCAVAPWGFRIPVALFSTVIVLSTVTTGWLYFTDVLKGLAIAGVSLFAARDHPRKDTLQNQRLEATSR